MLQKLSIRNYQRLRKLEIEFDEFITCFIGPTDSGKSATLRALRWLATNRPSGTACIRHGSDRVRVELEVDDVRITRDRGKKSNRYLVVEGQDDDRRGSTFRALGSTVPDGIIALLNISEVSWQNQHSPPFWLSDSPGQVSRNLNQIVALDLIDRTLANLAAEQRKSRTKVEVSRERLKQARDIRNSLTWVQSTDVQLRKLEEQEQQIAQNHSRIDQIEQSLADVQKHDQQRLDASRTLESVSSCVRVGEEMTAKRQKIEELEQLLYNCRYNQGEVCRAKERAVQADAGLKKVMKGRCPVCRQPFPRT